MPKRKLSAEAQQQMAKLSKKAMDNLKRAARHQASSDAAMAGSGWDADSSAQLWDQAAEELRLTALDCIERMQDLGASQKDLAPLWDMVLEAQQAELAS
jgi:hypothetical protein